MKKISPLLIIIILLLLSCSDKSGKSHKTELSGTEKTTDYYGEEKDSAESESPEQVPEIVTDIDGNEYKIIKIGKQTWMAENLKTTRYNDGTAIPLVKDKADWAALSTPGYCWYENEESFKSLYGALYNGYAVSTRKLCPTDWHIPSDSEWTTLINYLGGENSAGEKLKASGTAFWVSPNTGATNESSFTALPGGLRYHDGSFHDFGFSGFWWTSTEYSASRAFFIYMDYNYSNVFRFNNLKKIGFSVRCIRNY